MFLQRSFCFYWGTNCLFPLNISIVILMVFRHQYYRSVQCLVLRCNSDFLWRCLQWLLLAKNYICWWDYLGFVLLLLCLWQVLLGNFYLLYRPSSLLFLIDYHYIWRLWEYQIVSVMLDIYISFFTSPLSILIWSPDTCKINVLTILLLWSRVSNHFICCELRHLFRSLLLIGQIKQIAVVNAILFDRMFIFRCLNISLMLLILNPLICVLKHAH